MMKFSMLAIAILLFILIAFFSLPHGVKNDQDQDAQVVPDSTLIIDSEPIDQSALMTEELVQSLKPIIESPITTEPNDDPEQPKSFNELSIEFPAFREYLMRLHRIESNPTPDNLISKLQELFVVTEDDDPKLDLIDIYVSLGVDPNQRGSEGSPLIFAASNWMLPVLKRMHQLRGTNFNGHDNLLPLMHAVVMHKPENDLQRRQAEATVKFLISIGGDIEHLKGAYTPLMYAIKCQNVEMARILLDNGADVDGLFQEKEFITNPLILAVRQKDMPMIRLLTRNGANVLACNKYGKNALHEAASIDFVDALRWFIEDCRCNRNVQVTPLSDAEIGNLSESEKGRYHPGASVLHFAAKGPHIEAAKYLINECGVDRSLKDSYGRVASFYVFPKTMYNFDYNMPEEERKLRIKMLKLCQEPQVNTIVMKKRHLFA